jgi:hypothetical protein
MRRNLLLESLLQFVLQQRKIGVACVLVGVVVSGRIGPTLFDLRLGLLDYWNSVAGKTPSC